MLPSNSVRSSYKPSLISLTNFLGSLSCVFEQKKSVMDFLLFFLLQGSHKCLKVASVCQYPPIHAVKIQ